MIRQKDFLKINEIEPVNFKKREEKWEGLTINKALKRSISIF